MVGIWIALESLYRAALSMGIISIGSIGICREGKRKVLTAITPNKNNKPMNNKRKKRLFMLVADNDQ